MKSKIEKIIKETGLKFLLATRERATKEKLDSIVNPTRDLILQTVYKEIAKALPTHNPSFMTRGEVKEVLRRVLEVEG